MKSLERAATLINTAIPLSGKEDMEIYQCLCSLSKEVREAHDIRVVSKWLHDYFEREHKGGAIDFNIG